MKPSARVALLVAALTMADFAVATAEAGMITWHWAGTVTGYSGVDFGPTLDAVVPLGTPVDLFMTLDPDALPLNTASCLHGTATASLQFLGRSYTNGGYVWEDAMGFGPGICAPSFNYVGVNHVEIVVPSWGFDGPALPDGWIPFAQTLDGVWWGGDLTNLQPTSISSQLPAFYRPRESFPQRLIANLQAVQDVQPSPVPEPATMTLVGVGLAFAARRRWRRQRVD